MPSTLVDGQRLDQPTFHALYEAMPPGTRAELINGVVLMPGPVGPPHGRANMLTLMWLGVYQANISARSLTTRSTSACWNTSCGPSSPTRSFGLSCATAASSTCLRARTGSTARRSFPGFQRVCASKRGHKRLSSHPIRSRLGSFILRRYLRAISPELFERIEWIEREFGPTREIITEFLELRVRLDLMPRIVGE
jgi:hypothetical protein